MWDLYRPTIIKVLQVFIFHVLVVVRSQTVATGTVWVELWSLLGRRGNFGGKNYLSVIDKPQRWFTSLRVKRWFRTVKGRLDNTHEELLALAWRHFTFYVPFTRAVIVTAWPLLNLVQFGVWDCSCIVCTLCHWALRNISSFHSI